MSKKKKKKKRRMKTDFFGMERAEQNATNLELDRFDESFLPACKFGKSFCRFFVSRQMR